MKCHWLQVPKEEICLEQGKIARGDSKADVYWGWQNKKG